MKYKECGEPSLSNVAYIKKGKGGKNRAIEIKNGSCLPNCVGYVNGRWIELGLENHKLCVNDAERFYSYNDGYERGQTPKRGAVVCWLGGNSIGRSDGAGHVAIVEEVYEDGSYLVSASDYGGKRYYTKKIGKNNYLNSKTKFQGFIYIPLQFDEEIKEEVTETPTYLTEFAKDVINGKYGNGDERKTKIYNAVQKEVNRLLK